MTDFRLTDNAEVAAMLDGVDELPCIFCAVPSAVPDFVMGLVQRNGDRTPIVVCSDCSDALTLVVPLMIRAASRIHIEGIGT